MRRSKEELMMKRKTVNVKKQESVNNLVVQANIVEKKHETQKKNISDGPTPQNKEVEAAVIEQVSIISEPRVVSSDLSDKNVKDEISEQEENL